VVTEKTSCSNAVTTVTSVTSENDKDLAAARSAAELDEPGLSRYTIRDLANWYEEEGNRRRAGLALDQRAVDRDLRRVLAERGVFPEFIWLEFERVMQIVFAPLPRPASARSEEAAETIEGVRTYATAELGISRARRGEGYKPGRPDSNLRNRRANGTTRSSSPC
jgi:hypothetical protein